MVEISRLNSNDTDFWTQLQQLRSWDSLSDKRVTQTVREIVHNIKTRGDAALLEYTQRFDQLDLDSAAKLEVSKENIERAWQSLDSEHQDALAFSANRVRRYHEHQIGESWQYTEDDGTVLGQKITPLNRAGLYVPGGKASYPSSVIMNAIPAKVAGVPELIMVVPSPKGELNPMVLAAAKVAEVDRVFTVGGAQAIAALAYGTETIPAVDKIVGPGNIYVATAKAMVFGAVGIDMVAGPSEVLIICDGSADPDWVAMDLFSQAEHDEEAQSILIATDAEYIEKVQQSIDRLLPEMERATIIETSLNNRGAMILVKDLNEAAEISNYIAPEHLELSVENAESLCNKIHNAGAIFMGHYTAEPVGDYCAGPNHVLPTSRTARFSSPLGVYDFQKRSSIIKCSAQGAATLGKPTALLARSEGLTAHARSAEYRTQN